MNKNYNVFKSVRYKISYAFLDISKLKTAQKTTETTVRAPTNVSRIMDTDVVYPQQQHQYTWCSKSTQSGTADNFL